MGNKLPTTSTPVSFRLDEALAQELARRGSEHGMSMGEYARKLVTEALQQDPDNDSQPTLAELQKELSDHRDELAVHRDELRSLLSQHQLVMSRHFAGDQSEKMPPFVKIIREDIATAVMAILVKLGRVEPAEIQAWLNEIFYGDPP